MRSDLSPDEIQAFLDRHDMSQSELARRAGIGRQTLIRYLKQGTEGAHRPQVRALVSFIKRIDRLKGGAR